MEETTLSQNLEIIKAATDQIRLAVGEPTADIGDVADAVDAAIAGSGGLDQTHIAVGLTQPDASQYKYWIPIDATLDEAPLKNTVSCTIRNSINTIYSNEGAITRTQVPDYNIGYSPRLDSGLALKDYTVPYKDAFITYEYDLWVGPRVLKDKAGNITFNIPYSNTIKTVRFSSLPNIISGRIGLGTDGLCLDNNLYIIYPTASSTCVIVAYDLATDNCTQICSFSENASNYRPFLCKIGDNFYFTSGSTSYGNLTLYKVTPNGTKSTILTGVNWNTFNRTKEIHYLSSDIVLLSVGLGYPSYLLKISTDQIAQIPNYRSDLQSAISSLGYTMSGSGEQSVYSRYYQNETYLITAITSTNSTITPCCFKLIPDFSNNRIQFEKVWMMKPTTYTGPEYIMYSYTWDYSHIYSYDTTTHKLNQVRGINDNFYVAANGTNSINCYYPSDSAEINEVTVTDDNLQIYYDIQPATSVDSTHNVILLASENVDPWTTTYLQKFYLDKGLNFYTMLKTTGNSIANLKIKYFYNNQEGFIKFSDGTQWLDCLESDVKVYEGQEM